MITYPEYFYIELTQNCNLYCTMCRPHVMTNKDWFMSNELLDKVCEIAETYAKVVDLRGWGESTLDNRLIEVARRFQNKAIHTRIYTNMNARDTEYWVNLAKTGIEMAISIEAGEESLYSKLRRGGNLLTVKNHLKAIVEAKKEYDAINVPYFSVVVSENNIDHLLSLVTLASETGVTTIELNPISCRDEDEPSGRRTGLRSSDFVNATLKLRELLSYARSKGITVELAANLFSENRNRLYSCIHPWKYCCICYDGSITFCDHLLHHKGAIMGNLYDSEFEDIWFGDEYMELRKNHSAGLFSMYTQRGIECEWCYKNRYGNSEWLIDTSTKPILLEEYLERIEK